MLGIIGTPIVVRKRRSIFEIVFGALAAVIIWFVVICFVIGILSSAS